MTCSLRRRFFFSAGLLLALWAVLGFGPSAFAAPSTLNMQAEDEREVSWQLTADKVTTLSDAEVMEAEGNVILRRGDEYLKADYARYYMTTKWVFLRGNVEARMGKDTIKAKEAEFDLRSRVGWLKQGEVFMAGPHIYFSGEHITKHWGDVYSFKQAKITACDNDVPAWSITADEAVVEIDGYAQVWRSTFQVKDQPVMYSPWLVIPAKKERQTGFLPPEFGQSSRRGVFYNQPYFWAIDESRDMTFNTNVMEKHGVMLGAQYRSRPSAEEATWMRVDWLSDKRRVTDDSNDKIDNSDGLVRTNSQRYWLRGMYDGHLPGDPKWRVRGNFDYVSDQNYLREFKNGLSGFKRSRDEMFSVFRRDLRERDQNRESGLMVFRDWERASVALSGTYIQNKELGNGNRPYSSDPTVQRVPQLSAFWHKGRIFPELPVEVAASTEAGYMYRRNGTRGLRYQLTPKVSVPVSGRYGSVIATAGVRQAVYSTENQTRSNESLPKESGDSQTVPEYQVDGSTEFMRVFPLSSPALTPSKESVGQTRWTAVRHAVQPRVSYRHIPFVDQDDNPKYDGEDRILPKNEMVYSLTNVLTRKRDRVVMSKPAKKGEAAKAEVVTDYLDFLRVRLEQGYSIREASRSDDRDIYARRPFSDVFGEAQVSLDGNWWLINRSFWSPYMNKITRHDHGLQYVMAPYGSMYTGLDYRRALDEFTRYRADNINSFNVSGSLTYFNPFTVHFTYRRDYERNEDVERTLDLVYNHQCFQLIARASSDAGDVNYQFMVVLAGFGD